MTKIRERGLVSMRRYIVALLFLLIVLTVNGCKTYSEHNDFDSYLGMIWIPDIWDIDWEYRKHLLSFRLDIMENDII